MMVFVVRYMGSIYHELFRCRGIELYAWEFVQKPVIFYWIPIGLLWVISETDAKKKI